MAPKKRAVVYIVDASPSMRSSFAAKASSSSLAATTTTTTTRFESAKTALVGMVGNLFLQSASNECCVMLLKTRGTNHHLISPTQDLEEEEEQDQEQDDGDHDNVATATATAAVPFGHITELTPSIIKPSCDMMKRIEQGLEIDYETQVEADFLLPNGGGGGGDLAHGILLATDALYKKTNRLSMQRSIVVITDGMHQGCVDFQQLLYAIDVLRDLNCPIHVIGLDFPTVSETTHTATSTSFTPAPPPPVAYKNDKVHQCLYKGVQQWQAFLETLLDKTGGQMHVVHDDESLQAMAATHFAGFASPKKEASCFGCDLILAPNLTLKVKTFVLWQRTGCYPSIKQNKAFVLEDRYNNNNNNSQSQSALSQSAVLSQQQHHDPFKVNALGQHMLVDVAPTTSYVNLDKDANVLFGAQDTAKAINYADKWIALDKLQLDALKYADTREERTLQVLGYLPRYEVPMTLVMGPPVLVAGGDVSQKSTAAIAALARALFHLDLVAITMYTKSKNGKPVLGGLFPQNDQIQNYQKDKSSGCGAAPLHLLFLELPFAQDVKKGLPRSDWQDEAEELMEEQPKHHANMATLCDNLIDALTLSSDNDDDLHMDIYNTPVSFPNPLAVSWKQTIIQRILDPTASIVDARCGITASKNSHHAAADNDLASNANAVAMEIDKDDDDQNGNQGAIFDPMATPLGVLKQAHASLSAFYQAFPAPKTESKDADKKRKAS